jgi:hypothetical protein
VSCRIPSNDSWNELFRIRYCAVERKKATFIHPFTRLIPFGVSIFTEPTCPQVIYLFHLISCFYFYSAACMQSNFPAAEKVIRKKEKNIFSARQCLIKEHQEPTFQRIVRQFARVVSYFICARVMLPLSAIGGHPSFLVKLAIYVRCTAPVAHKLFKSTKITLNTMRHLIYWNLV